MKINKLIKIVSLFMIVGVVFTSCEDDDTVANENLVNSPTQVKIEFTDQNDGALVLEAGGTVSLTVSLSEALSDDAILTLDVTSSDGSLETTTGVTEVTYTSTATIAAGETSSIFDFTFSDDTLDDISEVYTVSISNLESISGSSITSFVLGGGDLNREIGVFDTLPDVLTIGGDVEIALTWASGQDMDLELYEGDQSTANQIDGSYTVSSVETVTLTGAQPNGNYSVWIEEWFGLSAPVDYTLTINFPDAQQEVFTGTVTADGFYLVINKVTIGSVIGYSFTQL